MAAPTLLLHLPPPPLPSGFKASSLFPPSLPSFLENEVDDGMEGKKEAADKEQEDGSRKRRRGVAWLDGWMAGCCQVALILRMWCHAG